MTQNEFALLVSAGAIERVTVYRDRIASEGWSVWGYADDARWSRDYIETARGGQRTWASLDTAHQWLRKNGWTGSIEIDG